ncbi:MAG: S8 family serine peptidase [bacterium]
MQVRTSFLAALVCLILLLLTLTVSARSLNGVEILNAEWRGQTIEYLDREILVGLNKGLTEVEFVHQLGSLPVDIVRHADRFGFLKLRTKNPDQLFELIDRVEALQAVRYAEPNMVDHLYVIPNDPDFVKQWHYHNTGQVPPGGTPDADMDCPEGWDISTGSNSIIVGVLDSGIPMQGGVLSHPDLDEPSKFLIGTDISGGDAEPMDENGHGTHVSGTIGAESDNGIGVAGVAWDTKIMAIQVFDRYGSGSHENFRDGCIFGVDNGCKVLNYSGGGSAGETKEHGVAYADSNGVVLCAAAGNSYQGSVSWPGAYSTQYSNCICVSSTNTNDGSSGFSSIGPEVTIAAPGGTGSPFDTDDIWSTFPNYEYQIGIDYGLPQSYGPLAGTSMATPHVTGLCALILGVNPNLTPDDVRQILISTADDLGPTGFDNQFGWGRVNTFAALSQLKLVTIAHTPLPDTKDTVNDYEVLCTIFSDTLLVTSSLKLHYENGVSQYNLQLTPTGNPDEYHAYIAAQSPGTTVEYQLFAANARGDADTTDLHSFYVIDYAMLLNPTYAASVGAVDDTMWYEFTVTNDGLYNDSYTIAPIFPNWTTKVWEATGTTEISSLGPLAPYAAANFLISVEVPTSLYGDYDSTAIRLTSQAVGGIIKFCSIRTMSAGEPLSVPFSDVFPTNSVNIGKWVDYSGVEVNSNGLNEPSEVFSLNLDGNPNGGDYIISQAIDLGGHSGINISYYFQRGGGGEVPDVGDDLTIDYMNDAGGWSNLMTHLGDGTTMTSFEFVTLGVPLDGYHSGFRLRLSNTATSGDYDDWFVDNILIDWGPAISASPGTFSHTLVEGDSTFDQLVVENGGPGGLTYSIDLVPDLSGTLFGRLLQSGQVNPATYVSDYVDGEQPPLPVKGGFEGDPGPEVLFNAGGPDNFGYFWIDSDEPNGPTFNWVDVLATGTDVAGGLDDDNFIGPFPIGFAFPYYNNTYTDFYVCSNGMVGFGPTSGYGSVSNTSLPTAAAPNNIIAWCWDDLDPVDPTNPGVQVVYDNVGGTLVIQFEDYPEYSAGSGDVIDAEIILHPDGRIVLQYNTVAPGFDVESASIGIENEAGDDGLQVVHNALYLHDALAIEIVRPTQWLTLASLEGSLLSGEADTIAMQFGGAEVDSGYYKSNIEIYSNDPDPGDNPLVIPAELWVGGGGPAYTCGDANGDEIVNITDATFLIAYIFAGGAPPDPLESGDANCDALTNITDATYLIAYIFGGGPEPCADCP